MLLEKAAQRLKTLSGKKFSEIFTEEQMEDIIIAKGRTGQLLELSLGLQLSSTTLDFEDGELKTNKCDRDGKPLETIFITQIMSIIDELLTGVPFENTKLYEKIHNILYVPVCKVGNPKDWMFLDSVHINLDDKRYSEFKEIWKQDYDSICMQLEKHIETSSDGFIHTSSGRHIQIRSKDAKDCLGKYHPIYSEVYGRYVSNKNHAFYFKKDFIKDVRKILKNQ